MQPLDWALLPFSRYFDFSGRSSRAEYWYFTALMWFVSLLIQLGRLALGEAVESVLIVVNALFGLGTFIPSLAVAVRRLHDINRSGFVVLKYIIGIAVMLALMPFALYFVPLFGFVLGLGAVALALKFLVLMVIEGDRGPNLYGPSPYGFTSGY
jgi:uncharacterized membrane protein YhaH (DUF805 family)